MGNNRRLIGWAVTGLALVAASSALQAQTKAPSAAAAAQPVTVPDLSGNWLAGGGTFSITDPTGKKVGTPEDDTPYKPAALAKLKSERPAQAGTSPTFDTTDPRINYCDPIGLPRIYAVPNLFKFVQTPDTVYMLFEYGTVGLQIGLNREHPEDPDPTWWGDSTGRYEGDTLVIDTVGFNDKTWLDHAARPHSDELHLVQRFRRVDHNTLQLDVTFDDPKDYTRPWTGRKTFKLSQRDFVEHSCSMSENEHFRKAIMAPAINKPSGK
jgi:hypothetical protein